MSNTLSKRVTTLFCVAFLFSAVIFFRVFSLSLGSGSTALSQAANSQSSYTIKADTSRGLIYDCNLKSLVGNAVNYKAAVVPSTHAAGILGETVAEHTSPFVVNLDNGNSFPVLPFSYEKVRYSDEENGINLCGFLNGWSSRS